MAIPSRAITKTLRLGKSTISESLISRDAMPILDVPSPAALTPTLEPPPCTSIRMPVFSVIKASASFSARGWTVVDPVTETVEISAVGSGIGAPGVLVPLHAAVSAATNRIEPISNRFFFVIFILILL